MQYAAEDPANRRDHFNILGIQHQVQFVESGFPIG
jgi:hypothetical protein